MYQYIREQLRKGILKQNEFLSISQLAKNLEIGRTPLRDALLQLQIEGLVTFLPQRGIKINELSKQEILNNCEILGVLEAYVLLSVSERLGTRELTRMKNINDKILGAVSKKQLHRFWELNYQFHKVYNSLSKNSELSYRINIIRRRLYGFSELVWDDTLTKLTSDEHIKILDLIEKRQFKKAADFLQNVHCQFPKETLEHLIKSRKKI